MLCGIRKVDGEKVFARSSNKLDAPFTCPDCMREVGLRKGNIKAHHFAHKPPSTCEHGKGESDAHRKCKEEIYDLLSKSENVTDVDIEKNFGTVISDVFFKINNVPVAVEIQRSNLTVNKIIERTVRYKKLGIHVLWLALFNENLKGDKYKPKAWEKWCHATYYGRVYYWQEGLTVVPAHFTEYKTYVEPSSWFAAGGEECSAGGYYKTLKSAKTPRLGAPVQLDTDFERRHKSAWSGGTVNVPDCYIYIDKQGRWW
jgi:competence protein CoiA